PRELAGPCLTVVGASGNNLQNVTVDVPLGAFVCVSGVSGSGKSTLVTQTLLPRLAQVLHHAKGRSAPVEEIRGVEHLDKVIAIDQTPIGRTPRSNPATYTGAFSDIRDLFASLPDSKMRGFKAGRFSFNVKGGRCDACEGDGLRKIEMHFLPDVHVTCEVCGGRRFNAETLEIKYRGYSIADVLEMTVEEALSVLGNVPSLERKLRTLTQVGLGYVHLGQSATTLSGGEAQRVKLAKELARVATGRTLYVLDEPTTGLHFEDVRKLLEVLQSLVDQGNTVLVIEHDLDVLRSADYVIDMGPEGGLHGGTVVATGTPMEIARVAESHTGRYLAPMLASAPVAEKKARKKKKASRTRKAKVS
ncbi:MAG: excinuclease ABC subunit A, partial [Myxococcota bacterium]